MNHRSNSHLCLFVLVAASAIFLGNAQVPFPGKCPEVKIVESFDAEAYMGLWYEYAKYPFVFEFGQKCTTATYSIVDANTVSVFNAGINEISGEPKNITGEAKVIGPGQLAVAFYPGQPLTEANYLVLATDYKTYSVVYNCIEFSPLLNSKFAWILTREREPSAKTIEAAKKILEENKVSLSYLVDTTQNECSQS
ncbi:apolipoprotein D-like [Drosophila ficusphila]|uniref:apolipoprotein D-like n=1 Tax=Drosophila ficusphila TaxID=30025 RepID=UPI0007E84A5E|nr:apolipoprotein D-like [Drosophila ficusphila]